MLKDFDVTTYDIVFFAGGHGTCVDFPTDAVGAAVSKALAADKVVATVCHGSMALVHAKAADGTPLVKGKKIACFTDAEEAQVQLTEKVPFLLATKLKSLGAILEEGEPWSDTAVIDGKLVSGQNPQSSVKCAKLALAATSKKVLIVSTSAKSMNGHETGAWSEEICGPYYVFKDAGCSVEVCSIAGGDIPIDKGSVTDQFKTENDKRMESEGNFVLKGTPMLKDFDVTTYDIVFFAGGHGTCVDFPTDAVGAAVSKALAADKVVATVCHGSMALVHAKAADGTPLVKGKKIACFTDAEEAQVQLTEKVPFLLATKLKSLGAILEEGEHWSDTAVIDGKLVSGQNPQSSVKCARLALAATSKKVLIVSTSAKSMNGHETGAWSEEICGPYYVFKDAGCSVEVCSIAGGDIPIDKGSVTDQFKTENDKRMESEGNFVLKGTPMLKDFDVTTYDIVFFAGGHGTCVDFPTDAVGAAVSKALAADKVVATVCHGSMALVHAKAADGTPLVKGKKIACFTDAEEAQVQLTEKVPFLLATKLKSLGAILEEGEPWSDTAVIDGKLVSGQNPQSSVKCARLALAATA
ncbi:unnamed protein product [Polarella glacialis]|uniref:DJ-1/PfpI domain-containing protein n=1 Tax=Polarella glacialis TaxID=89957 RepID=A0A813JSI9_POLGL|nr:unnamed protein product [Polarella glacialis]